MAGLLSRTFIFPVTMLFSACCSGCVKPKPIEVSPTEHAKFGTCWKNANGDLSAFLILVKIPKGYVPYIVSGKCQVNMKNASGETSFILTTGVIALADSAGVLHNAAKLRDPIVSSIITDLPPPTLNSKIFYIISKVHEVPVGGRCMLEIDDVRSLASLDMTYGQLIRSSSAYRVDLAASNDNTLFK